MTWPVDKQALEASSSPADGPKGRRLWQARQLVLDLAKSWGLKAQPPEEA